MTDTSARSESHWMRVFTIIGVALAGFIFIGPIVGTFLALPFYEGSLFSFAEDIVNPYGKESMKLVLYIVQGGASLIGLFLVPAFYWWRSTRTSLLELFRRPRVTMVDLGLVIGIVISFMFLNSLFIDWNAHVDLPGNSGFEQWARQTEDAATDLTKYLTEFSSTGQFLLGLAVIAVFAALGEELVFRGLLQPALHKATGNIHAAIWISAVLFSALHLQFFGFIPRVLLGALFGYLYFWSGNLIVPMFAHFVNNGFSVILIYFAPDELLGMSTSEPEQAPWMVVLVSTILTFFLLSYFRKINLSKTRTLDNSTEQVL